MSTTCGAAGGAGGCTAGAAWLGAGECTAGAAWLGVDDCTVGAPWLGVDAGPWEKSPWCTRCGRWLSSDVATEIFLWLTRMPKMRDQRALHVPHGLLRRHFRLVRMWISSTAPFVPATMRAEITPGSVPKSSSARCIGSTLPAIIEESAGDVLLAGSDNVVLQLFWLGCRDTTTLLNIASRSASTGLWKARLICDLRHR